MSFPAQRLHRLRATPMWRRLVRETRLSVDDFVYPLFIVEGEGAARPVESMPGVSQFSPDRAAEEAARVAALGIPAVILFGVPDHKDGEGSAAVDRDGVVPRAVRAIKKAAPDLLVWTDVCLCGATDHGHCGVLRADGGIDNDASVKILAESALAHAQAGADAVAPSDMMDGRVAAIRARLDAQGFALTPIVSYAAKYASAFYGPFRDAAHSAPAFGDRRAYQMDPANAREARREVALDIEEGADIVMVKPAGAYLDVIADMRARFDVPLAAYQVSGEYSMIAAAAARGWVDARMAALESLTAIKRAGADIIITYFAKDAAGWLKEG
jgi:porphobilinogen synthase